ncbi:MAG TPA: hypothetical protein PLS10_04990 [Chitinophagales bacterium]|nr:hypothetical protein [Chitinophagales bacterium]
MKASVFILSILLSLMSTTTRAASIDENNIKKIKSLLLHVKENDLDDFSKEFTNLDSLLYYSFKSGLFDSTQYCKIRQNNTLLSSTRFKYKKEIASTFVQLRYFKLFENNWNHLYFDKVYKVDEQKKSNIKTSVYFLPLRDSLHKKFYTLKIEIDNFNFQNKFGDIRVSDIYSDMYLTKASEIKKEDNSMLPVSELDNIKITEDSREEDKTIDTIKTSYSNDAYLLQDVMLKKFGLNWFVKVNLFDINNNKTFEFTSHDDIKFGINVVNEDKRYSSITFLHAEMNHYYYLVYTINDNKFCGILFNKDFDLTKPVEILLKKS